MAIFILVGGAVSSSPSGPRLAPPALGEVAAPVVIREYGDFQCPSCGAFFRTIEPRIRDAYITTRKGTPRMARLRLDRP